MIAALLAAAPLLAMIAPPPPPPPPPVAAQPIGLVVREERGLLRLDVVGLADRPYAAHYALDVAGQGPAGHNHTVQGGRVTLRPGERAVLLTVALGGGGAGTWSATLVVTPAEGAPYRQQRGASPTVDTP